MVGSKLDCEVNRKVYRCSACQADSVAPEHERADAAPVCELVAPGLVAEALVDGLSSPMRSASARDARGSLTSSNGADIQRGH